MIDIDTRVARAKLATLPNYIHSDIRRLHRSAQASSTTASASRGVKARQASARAAIQIAALNAAIVAAFEPLAAPDQSSDAVRILGGDV